jgi:hypothetical protein
VGEPVVAVGLGALDRVGRFVRPAVVGIAVHAFLVGGPDPGVDDLGLGAGDAGDGAEGVDELVVVLGGVVELVGGVVVEVGEADGALGVLADWPRPGRRMPMSRAMMAMTTSSSMSVKAGRRFIGISRGC